MSQKPFFRDKQGRIRYTGGLVAKPEQFGYKQGRFITKGGRVIFIGGPGSGSGGTGKGVATTRSMDNLPSEDNLIPDAILEQVPLGTFENCASGCGMANYPPPDMLEQYRAPNPYAAMRWYANETYWGTPRHPERILGDTPITRFFFKFADGGEKIYEVSYNEGEQLFYIAPFAPSSEFFRPVTKPKRGATRVPLWSDFVPFDVKEGRFITKDNRVIFIGGPGAGGGSSGTTYHSARNSAEWRELAAQKAPPPDQMYRWSNLLELHELSRGNRNRSLDISEDPEFYFPPPAVGEGRSWPSRTYVRVVLDGPTLAEAGWKRDPGLFGEMAWRAYGDPRTRDDSHVIDAYKRAIRRIEIMNNPDKTSMEEFQDWVDFRFGKGIPVIKNEFYSEVSLT